MVLKKKHTITATTFFLNRAVPTCTFDQSEMKIKVEKEEPWMFPGEQHAYRVSAFVDSLRILEAVFLDYLDAAELAHLGEIDLLPI